MAKMKPGTKKSETKKSETKKSETKKSETKKSETKKSKVRTHEGWAEGDYDNFLNLTEEEAAFVEIKYQLVQALKKERASQHLTQAEVAERIGSGQARVAKMESGDPSVSLDLLCKTLLALGKSRKQLGRLIAA